MYFWKIYSIPGRFQGSSVVRMFCKNDRGKDNDNEKHFIEHNIYTYKLCI